ncbi:Clp protease N-terminal domain-containing protein [Nonomuraea candida]|uniref:Clp protease N-terminal domain-containing protein n=1 Tax=Nonomuraea candida TaxID=359159 RepID=UPI0005BA0D95|nr:Clp protease N-terminal domain-containing protein [Nonomuraea candida]
MFARFTEEARRAVVRAGIHALDAGRPALDAGLMLLGVAEVRPFALASFTASAADVRERVGVPDPRALLATLGIDLDEVRRRTATLADDPGAWTLRRSRVRPLRVTLYGPLGEIPLAMHARKVIEVAMWKPGPVTGERLLWGLLADGKNGAARILRDSGVNVRRLVDEAGIPARRAA